MDQQLQMRFAAPKPPKVSIADLVRFLQGKGWMSAEQISAKTGWSDRRVRQLASESDDIISSPGIRGYKLLSAATQDEYLRYRSGRRNQAREMIAKVIRTDRRFYSRPAVTL